MNVEQLVAIQNINANNLDGQKKLVEIMFGVDPLTLPFDEFLVMTAKIPQLFSEMDKTFKPEVDIDGVKFYAKELTSFSTREFIDFDTLAKEGNGAIPTLLALIYTNEEYAGKEYVAGIKEKAEIMKKMDAGTALGAINFFSRALLEYVRNLAVSSPKAKEMMEKNPAMKEAMEKMTRFLDGDGQA